MKRLDKFWRKGLSVLLLMCIVAIGLGGNGAVYAADVEPLEAEMIDITVWRGSGADETVSVEVGKSLLSQLPEAPKTLTNIAGTTIPCEGWMMDGSLIDENVIVSEDMDGKRITPKPHRTHTWVTKEEKAATCEEDGWTAGEYCSFCGEDNPNNTSVPVPATGHNWNTDWNSNKEGHYHDCLNGCGKKNGEAAHIPGTPATESQDQVCTICGYVLVAAHSHDSSTLKVVPAVKATCTEPARRAYYECTVEGCGRYFADVNGVRELTLAEMVSAPALGHSYGAWEDIGNGKQQRICSVCGGKEERDKPAAAPDGNNANQGNSGSPTRNGSTSVPTPVTNTGTPQTGDAPKAVLWTVMLLLSVLGGTLCVAKKKRI